MENIPQLHTQECQRLYQRLQTLTIDDYCNCEDKWESYNETDSESSIPDLYDPEDDIESDIEETPIDICASEAFIQLNPKEKNMTKSNETLAYLNLMSLSEPIKESPNTKEKTDDVQELQK